MVNFKSSFLQEASWRGLIHQATDLEALDTLFATTQVTAYIGFDPTAKSLHVGHLYPIMLLRLLQRTGHKPIVVLGGGTAIIGDPTGKDSSRPMLQVEDIQTNIAALKKIFQRFLNFDDQKAVAVNNYDWLSQLNYLNFLAQYGRYFSVNRMLTFDSVRTRLEREQPLSFLEFNYMVLQGYDFLELYRQYDCRLQMGGSDQWGNMLNGVELTNKIERQPVFGLTSPLVTTATGEKMGKTANGAVWLEADMLSAYDYWQYWRNVHDDDVIRFMKIFTDLTREEIEPYTSLKGAELNEAKIRLANEVTALNHGHAVLEGIHQTVRQVFAGQDGDMSNLPRTPVSVGVLLVDVLQSLGFVESKSEARRLIQGGGGRVNDRGIADVDYKLTADDFLDGVAKISAGKKRHGLAVLAAPR
jgi:tyrosyl-tRNA synthetase